VSSCREVEMLLAAHAFAALEPDEQAAVDTHLAGCADCRRLHSQLTALPTLLDLAGSADVRIASPPPLLEASVLAALPADDGQASGWRPRFARRSFGRGGLRAPRGKGVRVLVPALAAILVLLAVAVSHWSVSSPRPTTLRLVSSALAPGSRAVAVLRPRPWGTEVELRARHLTPTHGTQIYEMWFVSSRGRVSAGTFTVGREGRVTVTLACAAHADQYRMLGVTLEPDGLNPARRGPNILHARLHA
jgi:anti-sigma-K factor RskA